MYCVCATHRVVDKSSIRKILTTSVMIWLEWNHRKRVHFTDYPKGRNADLSDNKQQFYPQELFWTSPPELLSITDSVGSLQFIWLLLYMVRY